MMKSSNSGGDLVKTKSCDDLVSTSPTPAIHSKSSLRRSSDPNLRDRYVESFFEFM